MNTNFCVSLLLPVLAASLSAQDLQLNVQSHPTGIEASVTGARDGDLVVLVLGLNETSLKLPNGLILGVEPIVTSMQFSSGDNGAEFFFRMPRGEDSFKCLAQAVAISPKLPIDADGLTLSDVQPVAVER